MASSAPRPDPPYRRIAADIRAQIQDGRLRPGDRVPSIRQIAQRWDVAIATATRVIATLREEGLVEAKVGAGSVVRARGVPRRPADPGAAAGAPRPRPGRQAPGLEHVLRAAIAIADVEGLHALSMRRLASELDIAPMSLYRYVANKDELVAQMADAAFGSTELPSPGPEGWRAKLELIARLQWDLCRRHLWLPSAISLTRPLLVPHMLEHTEWTMRALDGLGLSMTTRTREALTLHALVINIALPLANEAEAEQETGVTLTRWRLDRRERTDELMRSGRFPLLAAVHEETTSDLEGLFEYGLARHLDGFAVLVESGARTPS
ncbi:GntR family transcriptional regulator [Actinomadura sp. NPDC048955]|uniref:TetR/AcrR family transcriptional regulator C-terminal domain-containing protein n=1 Tax=Actinomadura sp. NPDC048955 TaxID=3158228 RepID=UPI0033CE91A5